MHSIYDFLNGGGSWGREPITTITQPLPETPPHLESPINRSQSVQGPVPVSGNHPDPRCVCRPPDPPSVTDPLMSWAEEAHWSMGGLNSKRNRYQGRIEGNIERLRAHRDQIPKKSRMDSPAPTPSSQPVAKKRRRVVGLVDDEEEEVKKVRKLGDDFENSNKKVNEKSGGVQEGKIKKRRKLVKGGRKIRAAVVAAAVGIKSSPRN